LNLVQKNKCFVYYKQREPLELSFIINFLKNKDYKIFKYGEYDENDYIEYLKTCEFGFWLDAHESQGFALEEALSMNVPLLVWNVKFMSQEHGSNYQNYEATTIPYWNEQCGEYFYEQNEFEDKYKLFMSKLKTYEPRQYILNNLSMEVCEQKLIDLINKF
jgi:glycosyltransferase involved in cell wall biosynthesis